MSKEPGGVESESDAVSGVNASRFENGIANDPLVKVTERNGCFSGGDNVIEKRNRVSDMKNETESVDSESDFESEIDFDTESEDRDSVVVLADSPSGDENVKLSESDLVWGKVRSYPSWPGQVIDASLASKKAKKHYKKGKSLVAYFGDCSFAWNDVSMIKPFHQHLEEMVKQSNSAEFHVAIDCALEEVSRRVEFGLSCACVSEEAYKKLSTQNIVNTGIREDSRVRYGGDELSNAVLFEPGKLAEYMKHLACFPSCDASDELQIVVNRARLLAFQQWRGYSNFPEYGTFVKSVESAKLEASLLEPNTDEEMSSKRRKTEYEDNDEQKQMFDLEDRDDEKTKEKKRVGSRLIEKLDGKSHSEKKRKVESSESGKSEKKIKNKEQTEDSASQNSDEENNLSVGDAKELQKAAEPCCGIGAIPLKVESEMNSSTTRVEVEKEKINKPKHEELAERKISSPDEKLSSLHTTKTREEIPESISKDNSKYEEFDKFLMKISCSNLNDDSKKVCITETAEPTDVKDITGSNEQTGLKDCSADSTAPNALVLIFADSASVPSEEKLNRVFNCYGPLRESETQVMKKSKRAKVVFKRGEDAKAAFGSARKYSIFGPSLLSYQLKYVYPN